MDSNFKEKLDQFIKNSQNTNNKNDIKNEYFKLVKEFHPDVNKELKNEMANECMMIINYVYENLIHNKNNFKLFKEDEYEKYKINGKYCFVNEYNIKECISDKILFIYKLGMLEYGKANIVMLDNPSYNGKKEETGYQIIGHLYKAYKYFKDVIKMDKEGNWKKSAIINLHHAFKMNANVTRGLNISNEKGLVKI